MISPRILWSEDGLHFQEAGEMTNTSTGFFCPRNFGDGTNDKGMRWGLERYTERGSRGLRRFDCSLQAVKE
jgi:hypothetical protein